MVDGRIARRARPAARLAPAGAFLAILGFCASAAAHGFGQRYDLPVPLTLYLTGAAAAVILSFVVVAIFLRKGRAEFSYPRFDLLRFGWARAIFSEPVARGVEVLSVAVFLLVIAAGLFGTTNQSLNIAPLMVWVVWWVGVTYLSALVGDIWPLLNPWRILFSWFEALARRLDPDSELALDLHYPAWLGVWPSVLFFAAFAWFENAYHDPARPSTLAMMIMVYSVITWAGMLLFGRERWLQRGEVFTQVFGLYARFAPTEMRVTDKSGCDDCGGCRTDEGDCINCLHCFRTAPPEQRQFNLRPFAAGLLRTSGVSISMMMLVLLVLAGVTFDGFTDTPAWASLVTGYYASFGHVTGVGTLALVAFPLVFLALYLLTVALMPPFARQPLDLWDGAKSFVLSLVPIALAYHLAHYLTYLLVQGQQLIPLASDPFGFGWDLFGTVDYQVDINLVGAQFAWYTSVAAIVVGHIIAVWLAHVTALRKFRGHAAALRSQIPMLVLMVFYTVISLWIMAQPIIEVNPPT